jgi:hypothetical protein
MKCSEESRRSLFLHCATCLLLTFPAGRDALSDSRVDQLLYGTAGFPRLHLAFSPTSFWQCCEVFAIG